MTREIKWTTSKGLEIVIAISSRFELNSQGDVKTQGRKEVVSKATVDGRRHAGSHCQAIDHPEFVARFGQIAMTRDQLAAYKAAYAMVAESIREHNDACDRHEADLDEITDNTRRIENKMAY